MRCSVFENDETVVGWKVGSSVAYCEPCFREKMEREMSDDKAEPDEGNVSTSQKQANGRKNPDQRNQSDSRDNVKRYAFITVRLKDVINSFQTT